jgi:hypothetical protein
VRNYLLIAGIILITAACGSNSTSDLITVKVIEVEQVEAYTYLLVKGKGPEYWVAVPSMDAGPGETYHYQGGLWMENFHSKELDRTFDKVLFIDAIFPEEPGKEQANLKMPASHGAMGGDLSGVGNKKPIERSDVEIVTVEGTVSIGDLYADPKSYEGKSIKVAGEVTKYNPAIMELNWVHLQDGTEFDGKFDLTATSTEVFEVGSRVILEGILALDRDFGYGYTYEILLEEATAVR